MTPVKAKSSFRIFEHNNKGNKSYSLGLRIDEDNRKWWESLEAKLQELSNPALKKLAKPGDLVLIETNESGYSNIYAKVYEKSCKSKSLVEDGQDLTPFEELIEEEWYSCCILNINISLLEQVRLLLSSLWRASF